MGIIMAIMPACIMGIIMAIMQCMHYGHNDCHHALSIMGIIMPIIMPIMT